MTVKKENKIREDERKFEELVCYFMTKAKESGLDIATNLDGMDLPGCSDLWFWPYICCTSKLGNLDTVLTPTYLIDVLETDIDELPDDSKKERQVLNALIESNMQKVKRRLARLASDSVCQPRLICLDLYVDFCEPRMNKDHIFNFGLGDDASYPCGISSLPNPDNYTDVKTFATDLDLFNTFHLPVLQKYGDRLKQVIDLGENLDAAKKAIDLGFEICGDKSLDHLLDHLLESS